MADKKPGRGAKKKKDKHKKSPKLPEPTPAARKSAQRNRAPVRHRLYNGKIAMPVKYSGPTRHGSYIAAMVSGSMVCDDRGEPIPYHDLPLEPRVADDTFSSRP